MGILIKQNRQTNPTSTKKKEKADINCPHIHLQGRTFLNTTDLTVRNSHSGAA